MAEVDRRLAAILAADIAGYSRLMGADETGTFQRVSALRRRVVGSTWHRIQTDPAYSHGLPYSYWQDATRYQQVRRWVTLHRLRRWAAIDDDADGWDDADRTHLVHAQADTGLSDPAALSRLAELLRGQP